MLRQGGMVWFKTVKWVMGTLPYGIIRKGGHAMGIVTYEGVVEHGQIRLKTNARLPERARVYVIIPDVQTEPIAHVLALTWHTLNK